MNRSARRQHHEQARKRHRQELQQHAREAAKKPRDRFPAWFLTVGIGVLIVALLAATFAW
jgi:hypothetical protein